MNDERDLLRLCGLMVDGTLEDRDAARLAEILEEDAGARALYRNIMDVHARLLLQYEEVPAIEQAIEESPAKTSSWWQFAAAAALVLFTGLNAIHSATNLTAARELTPQPVAQLADAETEALADAIGFAPGEVTRMAILGSPRK